METETNQQRKEYDGGKSSNRVGFSDVRACGAASLAKESAVEQNWNIVGEVRTSLIMGGINRYKCDLKIVEQIVPGVRGKVGTVGHDSGEHVKEIPWSAIASAGRNEVCCWSRSSRFIRMASANNKSAIPNRTVAIIHVGRGVLIFATYHRERTSPKIAPRDPMSKIIEAAPKYSTAAA